MPSGSEIAVTEGDPGLPKRQVRYLFTNRQLIAALKNYLSDGIINVPDTGCQLVQCDGSLGLVWSE